MTDGGAALVRAPARKSSRDRHRHDPQVATDGDVVDVVALDREPLDEGELAASVYLHRAGDAWLHTEAVALLGRVPLDELELFRTRADQGHMAEEHVPQLGSSSRLQRRRRGRAV